MPAIADSAMKHSVVSETPAWSLTEAWHVEHRFFDFNHDGAVDIVPQFYRPEGSNVVAWLNDGTGHYVALKSHCVQR